MKRLLTTLLTCLVLPAALRADPSSGPEVPARLDLKEAIGFALDNNFAIRLARERIRQQTGVVLQVKALGLPSVVASGMAQRNSTIVSQTYPQSDSYWQAAVTGTQTLYAGGGIRASIREANLGREAAALDLEGTVNSALLDVRTRYYAVLLAREKIRVQEQSIALLKAQLTDATNRYEAGSASSFDKLRAQVSLANGEVPLITARNDFRIAIEQLRQSLGFTTLTPSSLRAIPEFDGDLSYVPSSFDLGECLVSAHENRPEILRLAKLKESADEAVTAAQAGHYPTVALTGGWQALKTGGADGFESSTRSGWHMGLQSQWSIFDGRAVSGEVAQARSLAEQARLSMDQTTLDIDVEVRQAYSAWQEANDLAAATVQTVQQAEESLRLASARYDAGSATQLDVQQSQVDLTQARTNLVQANYTYLVAVAQLREAMGLSDDYKVQ